jgi:hypothetical protein
MSEYIHFYNKHKYFLFYVLSFICFTLFVYLAIPFFFNYSNFKSTLEDKILLNFGTKVAISGDVRYQFLPSPRLKIKNLKIKDYLNEKKYIGKIDTIILHVPFKKLVKLKKIDFEEIQVVKSDIVIDYENLGLYKSFFKEKFKSKPIKFLNSKLTIRENNKKIFSVTNINFAFNSSESLDSIKLTGNFLTDKISINFQNKHKQKKPLKIILVKLDDMNFNLRLDLSSDETKYPIGSFDMRYLSNRFKGDYIYQDSAIKLLSSNFSNPYAKGAIQGKIEIKPFLYFDLQVEAEKLNFKNIFKDIENLDSNEQTQLFIPNKSINGKLSLDVKKLHTSSKLVQSIESELEFRNKDIIIHKLLLDLGKIGASDIQGKVITDQKYTKLYFDQNFYLDNNKIFFNRFDLKNFSDINNLNFAGEINLSNFLLKLNSVSFEEELSLEDLNFIEENFNQILFEKQLNSFFNYLNLKYFLELVIG